MIAGVVLAGGKSSRMGSDKSHLKIGSKTLLQHTKNTLKSCNALKGVYISGKNGIKDLHIEKGPIAGILACLEYLQKYDYVIFIPVDMPLINKYILLKLISQKNQGATYFDNYNLPLLIKNSLINRKIIKQQIENNKLSIKNTLKQLNAQAIGSHFPESVFLNANTDDEWQKIKKILQ